MLSGIATIGFLSLLPPLVPLDAIGRAPLDTHGSRALAEIMSPLLTDSEVSRQLAGLPTWRRADGDEPAIAATYELTEMGLALRTVMDAMGQWGAQWLEIEPRHRDPAYVLWATLKLIDVDKIPAQTTVVRFALRDRPVAGYWAHLAAAAA